jgi:hypothetical protein
MGVQDAPGRILMTQEAASAHGDAARPWLPCFKAGGRKVTAAVSDDSPSFTAALKAVDPQARVQADQFHPVQPSWGHLTQALFSYRRQRKARGEAQHAQDCVARAKPWWQWRWSLLKKPRH